MLQKRLYFRNSFISLLMIWFTDQNSSLGSRPRTIVLGLLLFFFEDRSCYKNVIYDFVWYVWSLRKLLVLHKIITCFTVDMGGRLLERQGKLSVRSPPFPKLIALNGAKCFSQTWEYQDKPAINDSEVVKILSLLFSARRHVSDEAFYTFH